MKYSTIGLIFCLLIVASCCACPRAACADIVYQLIDGAAGNQDGHRLSGFMRFDSPCGTSCTAANLTDFSFEVAGRLNYAGSYLRPADVVVVNGMGHLNVTAQSITLNASSLGQLAIGDGVGLQYVQWVGGTNYIYRSLDPNRATAWFSNSVSSTIAVAVPEPASLVLVGVLALVAVGGGRVRGEE